MRPELFGSPEVEGLLEGYGMDADPQRFLHTLIDALRDATPYGRPRPRSGLIELLDALVAGMERHGRSAVEWRRGRSSR
jgi:hypothetical protein